MKITLDMLTVNSVSVKTQEYNETGDIVGKPHRKAYVNSTAGRASVSAELPEAQQNAIFAVWGSTPTVTESAE